MDPNYVWDNVPVGTVFPYPVSEHVARQFYDTIGDYIILCAKCACGRAEVWEVGTGDDAYMLVVYPTSHPRTYSMQTSSSLTDLMYLLHEIKEAGTDEAVLREIFDRIDWYGGEVGEPEWTSDRQLPTV